LLSRRAERSLRCRASCCRTPSDSSG
jgi:hypothetical protein